MTKLTGWERKYLRGIAHGYKPLVQTGKDGLTDNVLDAVSTALAAHELIKVKITADRGEREQMVPLIEKRTGCECVGTVGRIAILYLENPDPDKQKIRLPKRPAKDTR